VLDLLVILSQFAVEITKGIKLSDYRTQDVVFVLNQVSGLLQVDIGIIMVLQLNYVKVLI
jgi:hypothetical protein